MKRQLGIRLWMFIAAVCGAAVAGYGFTAGEAQFAVNGSCIIVLALVLLRHNERNK